MPSNDKYARFQELADNELQGRDFRVLIEIRPSSLAVIAPHGGGIEPGTSEIVKAIAGTELSWYCFEGLKRRKNGDLHITSTKYDEPRCVRLVARSQIILAVHGCDKRSPVVYVGGRHRQLRTELLRALQDMGFDTREDSTHHSGMSRDNLCNKGGSRQGVQLEISRGLRETMFEGLGAAGRKTTTKVFSKIVRTVSSALTVNGRDE